MGLEPIEDTLEYVFKKINSKTKQGSNNYRDLKLTLIAMLRVQESWGDIEEIDKLFQDFWLYLRKLTRNDSKISFYENFEDFLYIKNSKVQWTNILKYLKTRNYDLDEIKELYLSKQEKLLFDNLPSNYKFLRILIFYLYAPRVVNKFFIECMTFPLSPSTRQLIKDYTALDIDLQHRVQSYTQKLLEEQNRDISPISETSDY